MPSSVSGKGPLLGSESQQESEEIDLYSELMAFSVLPPEERARILDPPSLVVTEAGSASALVPDCPVAVEGPRLPPAPERRVAHPVPLLDFEARDFNARAAEQAFELMEPDPEPVFQFADTVRRDTGEPFDPDPEPIFQFKEPALTAPLEITVQDPDPLEESFTSPARPNAETREAAKASPARPVAQEPFEDPPPFRPTGATGPLSDFIPPIVVNSMPTLTCPHCNEPLSKHDVFCIVCGGFFDETSTAAAPVEEAPEAPGKVCLDCGESITEDEVFCPICGSVTE